MKLWRIHPAAQTELEETAEQYLMIGQALAESFNHHYLSYRQQICENPRLFNIRAGIVRRVNLTPRFGEYYIAYMLWHEKVIILAIAHAKRRPYYWRHRISESKQMF
jgi:plasmid stabilization system protein ParE